MKQEQLFEEFCKVSDIRIFLLMHPDSEMVKASCLHYLGDKAQAWYPNRDAIKYPVLYVEKNNATKYGFKMGNMSPNIELIEVSWKTVFNTSHRPSLWGGIEHAAQVARDSGYKFFSWNGWVYSIEYEQTDIKTDQLNG